MAAPPALRVVEYGARVYRRTWRGSVISTFLNPALYLLAMGVGLGKLVDQGSGSSDLAIPYLTFLAPGLLAATAMQTAAGDASYPVMAGIKWRKTYHAALATPISVGDLVAGHLGWVTIRVTFVSVVYAAIMTAFGATSPLEGLLAVPPAVLTGAAFAARSSPALRTLAALALALGVAQTAAGVANVLLAIPVELTALHSALAALLVLTLTAALRAAFRKGSGLDL